MSQSDSLPSNPASIVEQLRTRFAPDGTSGLMTRAADEIERLTRELKNLAPIGLYGGHDIEHWYREAFGLRAALESVAFKPGGNKVIRHIYYCQWCHYSREHIAKHGHQGDCPLAGSPVETGAKLMTDAQIKHMVDRFLGWRLPENFQPDAGISFDPGFNVEYNAAFGYPPQRRNPIGTNLFDAAQAEAMVRYMVEEMPSSETSAE